MILLIDVSEAQGQMNWLTASSFARGAYIRLADGTIPDKRGTINWLASRSMLPRGGYVAFYPGVSPIKQAQTLALVMRGDVGELPPVVDVEVDSRDYPWSAVSPDELRSCLREVERLTGRRPMIYTANWFWPQHVGDAAWASEYEAWLANYTDGGPIIPKPWTAARLWQFTSSASGAAFGASSAKIDLSYFEGDEPAFAAWSGKEIGPVANNEYDLLDSSGKNIGHLSTLGTVIPTPPPQPPPPSTWQVDFFDGTTPGVGPVKLSVNRADINYDVQGGSLEPGLPVDNVCARATRSIWFPAGSYQVDMIVDDGGRVFIDGGADVFGGLAWKVQAAAEYKSIITFASDGQHTVVGEYVEYGGWAKWVLGITPVAKPPPVPPAPPATMRARAVGFHMMSNGPKPDGSENDFNIVSINGTDQVNAAAARGLVAAVRHWPTYSDPNQMANAIGYLAGGVTGPYAIGTNEGDGGLARQAGESYDAYFQRRVGWEQTWASNLQAKGIVNYFVGTFSTGTWDVTDPAAIAAFTKWYTPWLNSQSLNGKPVSIKWDNHSYSPNMGNIYKVLASNGVEPDAYHVPFNYYHSLNDQYIRHEVPMVRTWLDGTKHPYTAMILTPPPSLRGLSQLHEDAQVVISADWWETRWHWYEWFCQLDPRIQMMVASETGVDEGGIGGFLAHGATLQDFINWITKFLDLSCAPITITQGPFIGTWPSPFLVAYIFQYSGDPAWHGYDVTQFMDGLRGKHGLLVRA